MENIFSRLCDEFGLKGELKGYNAIKNGNINDTYILTTDYRGKELSYLAQRVNTNVFSNPEALIENAVLIMGYIHKKLVSENDPDIKRKFIKYYKCRDGKYCYYNGGSWWRVMSFVYNAVSFNTASDVVLHSTGVAFGRFQRQLDGFPAEKLHTVIPDFHNTVKRMEALTEAAKNDRLGRLSEVKEQYDFLTEHSVMADFLSSRVENGLIPLRVTHNDTKCNNVMFDRETHEPLAVIDLDTVMPGLMGHDFGDAVRFAASTAEEDEEDLSKVALDLNKFYCFASGFLPEVSGMITKTELDTLPESVLIITLELSARFLTDYLCGDTYFKVKKPRHNYYRALCQTALAADIERKLPDMRRIISEISENQGHIKKNSVVFN